MGRQISIYADGSSVGGTGGPTGWGWLIVDWTADDIVCAGSGGSTSGTNNTAEIQGAIAGLRAVIDRGLHVDNEVELVSDSMYTLNLANRSYDAKVNLEIVRTLRELYDKAKAKTRWVRGHNGDIFNEKCDELAKAGRDKYSGVHETRKRRRSRKREERRRKRALVKAFKRRMYGTTRVIG